MRKNPTITFQVEDDAIQDLLARAEKRGRGEKSRLINEAIRLHGDAALLNILRRDVAAAEARLADAIKSIRGR